MKYIFSLGLILLIFIPAIGKSELKTESLNNTSVRDFADGFNPEFEVLNGNIFMVAQIPELTAELANGDKVELVFSAWRKQTIFHIETVNASLVTEGDYDLLALVPDEVTRALKSNTLKKVIIIKAEGRGRQVIKVKKGIVYFTAVEFL